MIPLSLHIFHIFVILFYLVTICDIEPWFRCCPLGRGVSQNKTMFSSWISVTFVNHDPLPGSVCTEDGLPSAPLRLHTGSLLPALSVNHSNLRFSVPSRFPLCSSLLHPSAASSLVLYPFLLLEIGRIRHF